MKLQHRGLNIELAEDDARIPVIEALLFGRTLPPPLAPPPEQPSPDRPEAPEWAPLFRFWSELADVDRRELVLLTKGSLRPPALEKALGIPQAKVMGGHSRIARLARKHRVPVRVKSRGRVRADKQYYLAEDVIRVVKVLAAQAQGV